MITETFKGSTLVEAKEYLRSNFAKGCICPACGGSVKKYFRPLTSAMGLSLFLIYDSQQKSEQDYIHVESMLKESQCSSSARGDFPKLRFWGLIEAKEGKRDDDSPRNGFYRITERGKDFLIGNININSHVILYNNKVLGFSDKLVNITEVMKNKFNFSELMSTTVV